MSDFATPVAVYPTTHPDSRERGLAAAAAALRAGRLVQVPLEAGYALVADAFSASAVDTLRRLRGRPDLVPQVLVASARTVRGIAVVSALADDLMTAFWPGPLTLLLASHPSLAWTITRPGSTVPVRMPLQPVALELLRRTGPLAMVPLPIAGALPALALSADPWPPATMPAAVPSVVDASASPPVLVRPGGFDLALLREVCPELISAAVGS